MPNKNKKNTRQNRPLRVEMLEHRLCLTASVGWDGPGQGAAALTYHLGNVPTSLDRATVESALQTAFAAWSKVAAVSFTETNLANQRDSIDINFQPIDGTGYTLAQAYLPADINPSRIAGDIQIDSAESWEVGNQLGRAAFDLVLVAVHEIGHSLGLDHSRAVDAVMAATVTANDYFTALAASDVNAILALYAPATNDPNTDTNLPPTDTPPTGTDTGTGSNSNDPGTVDPGSNNDTHTGTDPGTDPGSNTGTDTDSDPGTGTDSGTDTGTAPGTDTNTDTGNDDGSNSDPDGDSDTDGCPGGSGTNTGDPSADPGSDTDDGSIVPPDTSPAEDPPLAPVSPHVWQHHFHHHDSWEAPLQWNRFAGFIAPWQAGGNPSTWSNTARYRGDTTQDSAPGDTTRDRQHDCPSLVPTDTTQQANTLTRTSTEVTRTSILAWLNRILSFLAPSWR